MISSTQFKLFLELEPQLREVLQCFYDSRYLLCFYCFVTLHSINLGRRNIDIFQRYGHCLKLLEDMKDNLLLDLYLAPHIQTLFSMIRFWEVVFWFSKWDMFRNRGLVQYFSPYISADLSKMALSFNTTIPNLVRNELAILLLALHVIPRKMSWWSWFWMAPFRPELTLTIGFFLHRCQNLEMNLISCGFDW